MSATGSTLGSTANRYRGGAAMMWALAMCVGCSEGGSADDDSSTHVLDVAVATNDTSDTDGDDAMVVADTKPNVSTGCLSDSDCINVFPTPPACHAARCNLSGNFCYIGNAPDGLFCAVSGQPCGGSCDNGQCLASTCAEVCSNGLDDDFDGKSDCDDSDCQLSPDCVAKPCSSGFAISCDTELISSTLGPGSWKGPATYDCVDWKLDGPERVYRIAPGGIANYSVALLAKAVDLRVVVVEEDPAQPCGRGTCVAFGEDSASWVAQPERAYLIVVAGNTGAAGAFALRFDCAAPMEWSCQDGADDDGDGAIDCADSDCSDGPYCSTCMPTVALSCGSSLTYVTDSPISTNSFDSYFCDSSPTPDNGGREVSFKVPAPTVPVRYTATLTTDSTQHQLFVLPETAAGKCDPEGCLAAGKSVKWTQSVGESTFLVVDGPLGPATQFDLDLDCIIDSELDCANGVDDDNDGAIDCSDNECLTSEQCSVCKPALALACNSAVSLATTLPLSTSMLSGGACSGGDSAGTEIVMTLTSGMDQPVRVVVHDADGPTSLSVMERIGIVPCNPSNCIDFSDWTVLFSATAGTTYDIVVDTPTISPTSFGLTVECGTPTELICNNSDDEDLDGLVDCEDPDCADSPACADCLPLFPITCGQTVQLPAVNPFSTTNLSAYACEESPLLGPELAFHLDLGDSQKATITLLDAPAGSRLLALNSSPVMACDPLLCFDAAPDQLTIDTAETTNPIAIVVDTPAEAADADNPVVLSVNCAAATESFCDDQWDNDGDGKIDCGDPDCSSSPACVTCTANSTLPCGSTVNGTLVPGGTVSEYGCIPGVELGAFEWVWEVSVATPLAINTKFFTKQPGMRMLLIDPANGGPCSLDSCVATSDQLLKQPLIPNKKYLFVVDGPAAAAGAFSIGTSCVGLAEICNNGTDDDGDTMPDCQDPDCYSHPQCLPPENCTNGTDDDGDNLVDCDDPDCSSLELCNPVEICDNVTDDDGDGLSDCLDPDCTSFAGCVVSENCENSEDDDSDGLVDCDDPDCEFAPECIVVVPENCINGKDDDGDSFTDCADSDCAGVGSCGQCTLSGVLYCGSKLSGTMTSGISGNNMFLYPCDPGKVYSGPEKTFRINIGTATSATVLFSGAKELSGHHIEFLGAGCSLGSCKTTYSGSSWVVPLTPKAGIAHYVTLDSLTTGNYSFNLDVQCN